MPRRSPTSRSLGIDPALTIKTLVFVAGAEPILALVRGDHTLHERKLARALHAEARPAQPDEIKARLGVAAGSVGPVGVRGVNRIVADGSLLQGRYVVGANRDGYHLTGVTPGKDFECEFTDLQVVFPGEGCLTCGKPLRVERVIEVGNIFKLGTKYSVAARRDVSRRAGAAAAGRDGLLRYRARRGSPPRPSSSATTPTGSSGPGRSRPFTRTWSPSR